MRKHTPGPWKTQDTNVLAPASNGKYYCIAPVSDPNDSAHQTEVSLANARLIAASPRLLSVLETVVSVGINGTLTLALYDQIRAAISKATREQPAKIG